jgi:hypothetical protein
MALKTVTVVFPENSLRPSAGRTYEYFTTLDVKEGQKVVVDSPANGYVCVKVVMVEDGLSEKASKPIVTVVDDTHYKSELEAQKKRSRILRELEEIDKKTKATQRFAHLAALDPRAKELLDSLDSLNA